VLTQRCLPLPAVTINSGETITVEMITHHAGDYYEGMIKGDAGIEDIYKWGVAGVGSGLLGPSPGGVSPGTTFAAHKRGASGGGDGVHVLTGPIAVAGAQPGDILKVEVLGLRPRVNPNTGKTFGINAAAWWGYHFGATGAVARLLVSAAVTRACRAALPCRVLGMLPCCHAAMLPCCPDASRRRAALQA
jgi:acetamidase/formamidase